MLPGGGAGLAGGSRARGSDGRSNQPHVVY